MSAEAAPLVAPRRPRTWRDHVWAGVRWALVVAFAAYLWAAFVHTEFNLYPLYKNAGRVHQVMLDLGHPDLSWYERDEQGRVQLFPPMYMPPPEGQPELRRLDPRSGKPRPGTLPTLLSSMNETLEISLVGTFISVLISFPLAFLSARNLTRGSALGRIAYSATRAVFNVTRAFPPYILAIIFVMMVGTGPFPGVLALAVHSIGMMGKLFAETIESIDIAPVEAVRATGASNTLIVWFGILPQVLPQFLAFSLYRWDMNIRMAFILGIVGAGGIGFLLDQYIRLFKFHQASTAFIIILVAVTLLDWASAALREKLG